MEGIRQMALREGWSSDIAEFRLFHEINPSGCFVLEEKGKLLGGVMTFRHRRSAWIGNLIVAPAHRGRGFGTELLKRALGHLEGVKVETLYLSAALGAVDLYEKFGFEKVSGINRWERLPGAHFSMLHISHENIKLRVNEVLRLDARCWCDDRSTLISRYCKFRKGVFIRPPGFLMYGRVGDSYVIGPWEVEEGRVLPAMNLLRTALGGLKDERVLIDVPEANQTAGALLEEHGFTIKRSAAFMCRGKLPDLRMGSIFAFASLGSMG